MAIRVADYCVQDEVADEQVPCRETILNAIGNSNAIKGFPNRFHGVAHPLATGCLNAQEFVTVDQFLDALHLVAAGCLKHRLADDAELWPPTGALHSKVGAGRGDAEPFRHTVGYAL